MLRSAKVATPATAATVVVPDSTPPEGFVPMATVMFPVNPVAVLPKPSRAVTCTDGVIVAPAATVDGCVVKTSCVTAPVVMGNAALVAVDRPAVDARSV